MIIPKAGYRPMARGQKNRSNTHARMNLIVNDQNHRPDFKKV